jgi:hypothetical protein
MILENMPPGMQNFPGAKIPEFASYFNSDGFVFKGGKIHRLGVNLTGYTARERPGLKVIDTQSFICLKKSERFDTDLTYGNADFRGQCLKKQEISRVECWYENCLTRFDIEKCGFQKAKSDFVKRCQINF